MSVPKIEMTYLVKMEKSKGLPIFGIQGKGAQDKRKTTTKMGLDIGRAWSG